MEVLSCSPAGMRRSFTPSSGKSSPSRNTTATATAHQSQTSFVLPRLLVTGPHATMTMYMPILAQMRAKAPVRSRCFWSEDMTGSSVQ